MKLPSRANVYRFLGCRELLFELINAVIFVIYCGTMFFELNKAVMKKKSPEG